MNKEQFYVGQRVKTWDADDSCNAYGHVTEIRNAGSNGHTANSVFIKWNDLNEPCEHLEDEFPKIHDSMTR